MVIRQRIWAVLVALAVSNTLFASMMVTPAAAFRHVYPLARNGRINHPESLRQRQHHSLGSRCRAGGGHQTLEPIRAGRRMRTS